MGLAPRIVTNSLFLSLADYRAMSARYSDNLLYRDVYIVLQILLRRYYARKDI